MRADRAQPCVDRVAHRGSRGVAARRVRTGPAMAWGRFIGGCVGSCGPVASVELVLPRIGLERRIVVADGRDLVQIARKKRADRPGFLVLMHMAELMREQAPRIVAAQYEHRMAERE